MDDREVRMTLANLPAHGLGDGSPETALTMTIKNMSHSMRFYLHNHEAQVNEVIERVTKEAVANGGKAIEHLVREEVKRQIVAEMGRYPMTTALKQRIQEMAFDEIGVQRHALVAAMTRIIAEVAQLGPGVDAHELCLRATAIAREALEGAQGASTKRTTLFTDVFTAIRETVPEDHIMGATHYDLAEAVLRKLEARGI